MLSRSTAISSCHFCVERSAMGEMKLLPTLLTTAFARPHVCLTKSRRRATSASFDTSAAKASDLAPALPSAAFTSSSLRASEQDRSRAELGERLCGRASDAAGGAGDDHD